MKNNLSSFIRECIIIGGKASDSHVLGKTRDRNYKPKIKIVREIAPSGIEVVYIHDLTTDYMEGMNSSGIGIVNSALLVSADEKAAGKYWQRTKKKKGASHDGPRIKRALSFPKLNQVIKSLVGYDTGLKGHTLVGNPKSLYSIEMTSKHNPIINKLDPSTGFDVRTNHGKDHKGAGYNSKSHPEDYLSSRVRKASAEAALDGVEDYEEVMPALADQRFKSDSNLNMLRKTDNMKSSMQTMMNLDDLEFLCYLIPDGCAYKGFDDRTPKGYKPKINVVINEYDEDYNLISESYDRKPIVEKKKRKKKKKPTSGSHPDESYDKATEKALFLDRPFNIGGWPKGKHQGWTAGPPVHVQIKNYFKKMGLL